MSSNDKTPVSEAKEGLDKLIRKQRVAFYKPIQLAEILFHIRSGELSVEEIMNVESYRNLSKGWRDVITHLLVGNVSTSSQRYQDNLFEENAMPPKRLTILVEENIKFQGVVERYIYQQFRERQKVILQLDRYLKQTTVDKFDLNIFLNAFIRNSNISRSIDKAYEIVVYALFNTLVKHLNVKVTLTADDSKVDLLKAFEEFARLVIGIDAQNPRIILDAKLYRAGTTNAADRGLDMWANFGSIVQVKHITLTEEIADDISESLTADRIVIVCKDSEKNIIERVLHQVNYRVHAIIVQSQLVEWYEHALQGEFSGLLGNDLINRSIVNNLLIDSKPPMVPLKPYIRKMKEYQLTLSLPSKS